MTEPPIGTPPLDPEPAGPPRRNWIELFGLLGLLLLLPSAIVFVWLAVSAADASAAGRAIGNVLGIALGGFAGVYLGLRYARGIHIGRLWPWVFVATAAFVLAIKVGAIVGSVDRAIDSYVVPRDNITYERDPEVDALFAQQMSSSGLTSDDVRDFALYWANRDGQTIALVQVMQVEPTRAGSSAFWDEVTSGLSNSAGVLVQTQVGGSTAWRFTAQGVSGVFWHVDNLAVSVFADAEAPMLTVAESLRKGDVGP